MISYFQVVAQLPVMWPMTKMLLPVCEYPCFKVEWNLTLLVFVSIMNQNWAETHSDIDD